jgi:NTE family protein
MKIALAFSGGGVRATVFHLGVLGRLARQDLLGNVNVISSVSGGSLATGLVISNAENRWPGSAEYLQVTVPRIHHLLTTRNLQSAIAIKSLLCPWRLGSGRASVLGNQLERQWGIRGNLAELPASPRIIVNATCYETGKNWRFNRESMGDYRTKYVRNPSFRFADALAASAAVPGLIGSLVVKTKRYQWSEYRDDHWCPFSPNYKRLHLWDGGVYDNLGVEALFKPNEGLKQGSDFLIVCDASRPLSAAASGTSCKPGFLQASKRLVDVATDQVRSLRARMLMDYFKQNPGSGAYLKLGMQSKELHVRNFAAGADSMNFEDVKRAAQIETTLRRLSHEEFSLLFRHGYQVADTTLSTYCGDTLKQVPSKPILFKAA